jgi:hypothetical protein
MDNMSFIGLTINDNNELVATHADAVVKVKMTKEQSQKLAFIKSVIDKRNEH